MQLKMVLDRLEACRRLMAALGKSRVKTLMRRLGKVFSGAAGAGEGTLDLGKVLLELRRKLGLARDELRVASAEHRKLALLLAAQMTARNRAVAELRPALVAARGALRGLFGPGGERQILGAKQWTPDSPDGLRVFGRMLFERLTGKGAELPPPRLPGVEVDPVALAGGFGDALVALESALEKVTGLRRQVAEARAVRNEKLARTAALTRRTERFVAALTVLACEEAPERPSRRRRSERGAGS